MTGRVIFTWKYVKLQSCTRLLGPIPGETELRRQVKKGSGIVRVAVHGPHGIFAPMEHVYDYVKKIVDGLGKDEEVCG